MAQNVKSIIYSFNIYILKQYNYKIEKNNLLTEKICL